MNRDMGILSFALVFFMTSLVGAESLDKEALTRELFELSGLETQIRQIPEHVLSSLEQERESLSSLHYELMSQIAKEIYDVEKIRQAILKRLQKNFDSERILVVIKWLRSPMARRITNLEEAASTPESFQHLRAFAAQLQTNPPPGQRLRLVQRLDSATDATEIVTDIVILSSWGVVIGANAALPKERQAEEDRLWQQIERQRAQIKQGMQEFTLVSLLYTYQALTDSELQDFIAFAESDSGRWYNRTIGDALKATLLETAIGFGKAITKALADLAEKKSV